MHLLSQESKHTLKFGVHILLNIYNDHVDVLVIKGDEGEGRGSDQRWGGGSQRLELFLLYAMMYDAH